MSGRASLPTLLVTLLPPNVSERIRRAARPSGYALVPRPPAIEEDCPAALVVGVGNGPGYREALGLIEQARATSEQCAILALTTWLDEPRLLASFAAGADGVETSAIDARELYARLDSIRGRWARDAAPAKTPAFIGADWQIDPDAYLARYQGENVSFTPMQWRLLRALLLDRGRVVTKEEISKRVWGDRYGYEETLAATVNSLRAKLGESGKSPRLIRTLPGEGYSFVGEEASA